MLKIFISWQLTSHNDLNAILSAHPSILIDHKVTQYGRYFRATKQKSDCHKRRKGTASQLPSYLSMFPWNITMIDYP